MSETDHGMDGCPVCGSTEWIPIAFGIPTPEIFEAIHRGEVAVGGCLFIGQQPDVECRKCSTQYCTGRDLDDEEDEEDWVDASED